MKSNQAAHATPQHLDKRFSRELHLLPVSHPWALPWDANAGAGRARRAEHSWVNVDLGVAEDEVGRVVIAVPGR